MSVRKLVKNPAGIFGFFYVAACSHGLIQQVRLGEIIANLSSFKDVLVLFSDRIDNFDYFHWSKLLTM